MWLQAATRALENLPEAVEPLQATLDASLPDWQYSVGFEAVRCMHAEVCRLLIRRRLPSLSGPQWVALVDECMHWERTVRCRAIPASQNLCASRSMLHHLGRALVLHRCPFPGMDTAHN